VLRTPGVAVDIAYGVGGGAVVGLLEMVVGRAGVGARLGLVGSLAVLTFGWCIATFPRTYVTPATSSQP
jgi:hypothetical protein